MILRLLGSVYIKSERLASMQSDPEVFFGFDIQRCIEPCKIVDCMVLGRTATMRIRDVQVSFFLVVMGLYIQKVQIIFGLHYVKDVRCMFHEIHEELEYAWE